MSRIDNPATSRMQSFARNPVMSHLDAIVPDALPAADKIHVDGLFVGNHHFPVESGIDHVYDTITKLV